MPTVLNRLIQQAWHQVLMPIFDPDCSNASRGFRLARSAYQAVLAARPMWLLVGAEWWIWTWSSALTVSTTMC